MLGFLGGPGGPGGVATVNGKATGLPTLCLSGYSTGMVCQYSVDIPRLSKVLRYSRKDVRDVPRYALRSHIAGGEGVAGTEVRELFHPERDCSTLSIELRQLFSGR